MDIVRFDRLQQILNKKAYKDLEEWMKGQTCVKEGIYEHDFLRWIYEEEVID
jgi:hypothetical protein|tara:strand:- start:409 stop:564 length:156 start_codon:yes stop_codon:yes gene_type:complete